MFENWVRRVSVEVDSGCIYISGAVEFDDRPGPVRDALAAMVWPGTPRWPKPSAVDAGQLRAGRRRRQIVFEMHGLILALHHDARFLRSPTRSSGPARASSASWRSPACGAARAPVMRRPPLLLRLRAAALDPVSPPPPGVPMPQYNPPLRDMQFVCTSC
jgi:hypothetical protein